MSRTLSPSPLSTARTIGLAAMLAWLGGCPGGPEVVEKPEAEASGLFVRGATLRVEEGPAVEGKVSDWFILDKPSARKLSGLGLVTGLKGTGDKGEAFTRTLQLLLQQKGKPEKMPVEGSLAAAIVSVRKGAALVKPAVKGADLTGGILEMTYLRDRQGVVGGACFGPLKALGKGIWSAKLVLNKSKKPVLWFRPLHPWPDVARAVAERLGNLKDVERARVVEGGRIRVDLPAGSDPGRTAPGLLGLSFYGRVTEARILLDRPGKQIRICSASLKFLRANIRVGQGVRVVSGGRREDFAVVEVRRGDEKLVRVRTTRKVRDVVRVLDRLGVDWGSIEQILRWAASSDALDAQVLDVSPEGKK